MGAGCVAAGCRTGACGGVGADAGGDCSGPCSSGSSESSSSTACRPNWAISAPGSHGSVVSVSPSRPSTASVEGRAAGSFSRQSRTTSTRSSGTPVRSGSSCAIRYIRAWILLSAAPNGSRPVAAYARTEPRQNTSHAVVTRSPRTCSGAMKPGEPIIAPVRVSPPSATVSRARAMPKSMTRGPSIVTRTLDGFRSRWISPARWMSWRAPASPAPRSRTERPGSGPYAPDSATGAPGRPETMRWSEGPAT